MATDQTKILPNSPEGERAVLGSILYDAQGRDGDRVWDVCQRSQITPETFYNPANREIYRAMQEQSRASKPLDYVAILEKLRMDQRLEAVGGAGYLSKLIDLTPTTAHAEYYIDVIKQKQIRRTVIKCAETAIMRAQDEREFADTESVVGMTQKAFLEIGENDDSGETWDVTTKHSIEHIEEQLKGLAKPEGLKTGLTAVDDTLLGLKSGEMIVIGARPSLGKTSLAMNIAEHVAIDSPEKSPVLVFSLEMNRQSLNSRMLIGRAELDSWMLRTGKYPENPADAKEAQKRLDTAKIEIGAAPIIVEDRSELDIMQIRAIARRKVKERGIKLVIIDYLTLCHYRDVKVTQSRYQEVSIISNQIKAMAKELHIPVIVLSQLSRKTSDRGDDSDDGYEKPKMSDLRESGSIEQDADVVILLHKVKKEQNSGLPKETIVEVINIAKNRNGATNEVKVLFDKPHMRFRNYVRSVKTLS